MFTNIVVGLDGSASAARAFERALHLARQASGSVHVVSVEEGLPAYAATVDETKAEDWLEERYYRRAQSVAVSVALRLWGDADLSFSIVRGRAADQLVRIAGVRHADLVVIGHTTHSRLHDLLRGSTLERVARRAPCPVLVVR